MKKYLLLFVLVFLSSGNAWAEGSLTRNSEFRDKYRLEEVVVFSRHNIRAPLAEPGSFISKITPYSWHDFGVKASELTMKGGVLETINGQYFHRWAVSEGLFEDNAEPSDGEIYAYANSKQRTIATARYFMAGFMPTVTVPVQHNGRLNEMDSIFSLSLGEDVSEAQHARIKAEYEAQYSPDAIRKACEELKPSFELLAKVLRMKKSEAYRNGSFKGFNDYNSIIVFPEGDEPRMTASLNDACSVVDALILQYYEEPDLQKAAFGRKLSVEEWHKLARIIETRDVIRFGSPTVQHYVSKRQRRMIADELQKEGRKFSFICGHDVNILNILKSMRVLPYDIPDAIEVGTPIGSKIVFEKWTDASGNAYVAVSHVYQTIDQLRNNTLLDLSCPPNCIPLQFEGLKANEDGLYPLADLLQRLKE